MQPNHLRIFRPQEDAPTVTVNESQNQQQTVSVSLGEILPLLADAIRSERTWLRDFAEDQVNISLDLYEVLLAYQYYRRPSA